MAVVVGGGGVAVVGFCFDWLIGRLSGWLVLLVSLLRVRLLLFRFVLLSFSIVVGVVVL